MIKIKRVYDPASREDGFRILVDRLWPRGISKERAHINVWMEEIAPTNELRNWYSHDPDKWEEFQTRYRKELSAKSDLVEQVRHFEKEKEVITLVYSSKEMKLNNAVALKAILSAK